DVEDLADPRRMVAVIFEILRQRDRVGDGATKVIPEAIDAERGRACAGQKVVSRRRADGLVRVGAVEAHAARGEAVEARRVDPLVAVGSEGWLQVVDQDKKNVRTILRCEAR